MVFREFWFQTLVNYKQQTSALPHVSVICSSPAGSRRGICLQPLKRGHRPLLKRATPHMKARQRTYHCSIASIFQYLVTDYCATQLSNYQAYCECRQAFFWTKLTAASVFVAPAILKQLEFHARLINWCVKKTGEYDSCAFLQQAVVLQIWNPIFNLQFPVISLDSLPTN